MNSKRSDALLFFSVLVFLLCFTPVEAQELEPRAYTNIPVGLNFIAAGYGYTTGGILFDPSIPLENANIRIHGSVLAYARSVKIGHMSGKVDVIMPYAWLSGTADYNGDPVSREVSGLGDTRVRMTVNFVGGPAIVAFSEIDISEAVVLDRFIEKQLGKMHPTPLPN